MLTRLSGLFFLTGALLSACGDDGNKSGADASTIDSATAIDACVGHTCGGTVAVTDPEGGQVLIEHMNLDTDLAQGPFGLPAGTTTQTRVISFFMTAETPNDNPFPTPGVCNNFVTSKGWPAYIGSPHTDVDVGTLTIKGKNLAGTDVSFDIPKLPKGTDQVGRGHDVFYQFIQGKVDDLLKGDSFYDVVFGGAGAIPATTFPKAVYLAGTWPGVSSPGLNDDGPITVGQDYTVKWTPGTSPNAPTTLIGGGIGGGIWLLDGMGVPTHLCIAPENAGTFTIPGAALTEWKAAVTARGLPTNKMVLLRNGISHQIFRLPGTDASNQRRIDMVSLECWAQVMDVQ